MNRRASQLLRAIFTYLFAALGETQSPLFPRTLVRHLKDGSYSEELDMTILYPRFAMNLALVP